MNTHSFTIFVDAPYSDELVERLFEAGCDDALIVEDAGHVHLDFDRDAESYAAAVDTARADVQRAGVKVIRIEAIEALAPLP
jgi:hypothetical protein